MRIGRNLSLAASLTVAECVKVGCLSSIVLGCAHRLCCLLVKNKVPSSPLGRKSLPTRPSKTELLPLLYTHMGVSKFTNQMCKWDCALRSHQRERQYLCSYNDNLRQLDAVPTNSGEDVLELVDDRNQLLHVSPQILSERTPKF